MKFNATFTGVDAAIRSTVALDPKARAGAKRGVSKVNKLALAEEKAALTRDRSGLLRKCLGDKVKVSGSTVYGVVGPRLGFRTTLAAIISRSRGAVFTGFRGRKGSDRVRSIKVRAARGLHVGDVIDPAKYSSFIEFGHRKGRGRAASPAYPFIRPARSRIEGRVAGIISAEISAAVRQGGQ